jgi:hypothetical protein
MVVGRRAIDDAVWIAPSVVAVALGELRAHLKARGQN